MATPKPTAPPIAIPVFGLIASPATRWDLTAAKQYTLSDQTVKILKNLDRDLKVVGWDLTAAFWVFLTSRA